MIPMTPKTFQPQLLALVLLFALALGSCRGDAEGFTLKGTITGAPEGTILYLEHHALEGTELLDSLQLPASGQYSLKGSLPTTPSLPDFYSLRLGKEQIHFALTPERAKPTISSGYGTFQSDAEVTATADEGRLQQQWLRISELREELAKAKQSLMGEGAMLTAEWLLLQDSLLTPYRQAAKELILENPASPLAYFTLFQPIEGQMPFNIYQKEGLRLLSAVANQWVARYPEAPRTKHLEQLTLQAMASERQMRQEAALLAELSERGEIPEVAYFDFELPRADGTLVRLSTIAKAHPLLLCFTSVAAPWSSELYQLLRDRERAEGGSGVKVILVALDQDPHLFESATRELPWVCLQDRRGLQSELVAHYNITTLPTLFFIDQNGEVMDRLL